MKFTFKEITAAREKVSNLTAEASQAEQEVATAEQNLTKEESNKGSDAEKIYERIEAARKQLSIRKIAAERADAKRADAQAGFEKLIKDSADPLITALTDKANEAAEQLKAQIAPLIGEPAAASNEFSQVIKQAAGVHERLSNAHRIKLAAGGSQGIPGAKPDLVVNVLAAEALI